MKTLPLILLSSLFLFTGCVICECGDQQPEEDWDNISFTMKMDSISGFVPTDIDSFYIKKYAIGDSITALDSTMDINLNFNGVAFVTDIKYAIPYDYAIVGDHPYDQFDYVLGSNSPYFRFRFTNIQIDGAIAEKGPCRCYRNSQIDFKLNGVSHSKSDLPLELAP